MDSRRIVDEGEALRWIGEGRADAWMRAEHRRKYDLDTDPSVWSDFRQRVSGERRVESREDLVPWFIEKQHRWAYPLMMLRAEAARRSGVDNSVALQARLDRWLAKMRRDNTVVTYKPISEDGFHYLPRGTQDDDLIRRPG